MNELQKKIHAKALELGFVDCGFTTVEVTPRSIKAFELWLSEHRHGDMDFMEEYLDVRKEPAKLLPGAKTAVVCLARYFGDSILNSTNDNSHFRVAKYAQGVDYHEVIPNRLDLLSQFISETLMIPMTSRSIADILPLFERDMVAKSGIGWQAKNSLLISQHAGSYTLIGTLLIDADILTDDVKFSPPAHSHADRCGSCTRCLDACPTQAITMPRVIDASLCISYLTIEHRGPIPFALRPKIGDLLFGCDICQDCCPWNRRHQGYDVAHPPLISQLNHWHALSLSDILRLSPEQYAARFKGAAVKRARYDGLLRNAAIVAGNTPFQGNADNDVDLFDVLVEQLFLQQEPLVRGHIAWAVARHNPGVEVAKDILSTRLVYEINPYVIFEIQHALIDLDG